MTKTFKEKRDFFFTQLTSCFEEVAKNSYSCNLQKKAYLRLESLGLPCPKPNYLHYPFFKSLFSHEFFLSKKRKLEKSLISSLILPECKRSHLVFVDGFYEPSLSCLEGVEQLKVLTQGKIKSSLALFLQNRMQKIAQEEKDSFVLINAACAQEPIMIYLPENTHFETPIQILQLVSSREKNLSIFPRIQIYCDKFSKANIFHSITCLDDRSKNVFWLNETLEIELKEGAKLILADVSFSLKNSYYCYNFFAHLHPKSEFFDLLFTCGSNMRINKQIIVDDEAQVEFYGNVLLKEKDHLNIKTSIDHTGKSAKSKQLIKSAIKDQSTYYFQGKMRIRKEAQLTLCEQKSDTILLDKTAKAITQPELEIDADDVKAKHGATISQLNDESIYYLQTRGIPPDEAKRLLLKGFCDQILQHVVLSSLKTKLEQKIDNFLNTGD